jgi:hypothetical protein
MFKFKPGDIVKTMSSDDPWIGIILKIDKENNMYLTHWIKNNEAFKSFLYEEKRFLEKFYEKI